MGNRKQSQKETSQGPSRLHSRSAHLHHVASCFYLALQLTSLHGNASLLSPLLNSAASLGVHLGLALLPVATGV